jgi:uncharacterized membrane protein SirB2
MYSYLLLVHIVSAFIAIVAVTGTPIVMSCVRTVRQADFGLRLLERLAILPKIGGTLLLLSGLAFGFQQTGLFRELWYWLAVALFAVILAIVAALLPAGMKRQRASLQQAQDDILPETYRRSRARSLQLEGIANVCVLLSIVLMVLKPF